MLMRGVLVEIGAAVAAQDIAQFERRPLHGLRAIFAARP